MRFTVLDSWRGLCACLVVLFHVRANSHIYHWEPLRNFYLFVDFFFVLSGFIITWKYEDALREGFGLFRFAAIRVARLYPLHVATLGFMVVLVLLEAAASPLGARPFDMPEHSLAAIPAHLLLIHSLHVFGYVTWNVPSWSISTEFWTYVLFGLCVMGAGRSYRRVLAAVLLLAPAVLLLLSKHPPRYMDVTYDFGIVRSVFGFAAGALACHLVRARFDAGWSMPTGLYTTVAELVCVAAVAAFVVLLGGTPFSVAAPFVFAPAVGLFAFEAGAVSRALQGALFLRLGMLSYSIYMIHFLVMQLAQDAYSLAGRLTGLRLFAEVRRANGTGFAGMGPNQWIGDATHLGILVAVIFLSALTYHYVEVPGRRYLRRRLAGGGASPTID